MYIILFINKLWLSVKCILFIMIAVLQSKIEYISYSIKYVNEYVLGVKKWKKVTT